MPIIDCCTMVGTWPSFDADLSAPTLLAAMQLRGVGKALAYHTDAVYYDPAAGNRAMEAIAAQSPALVPCAVLDPARYPACLDEARRCLERGTRCFRFCPGDHGYAFSPDLLALRELMETLSGARLVTVDGGQGAEIEFSQRLGELLTCPTALGVPSDRLGLALAVARSVPNLYLETSGLMAAGAVDTAVRAAGADRLLFASRAPLMSLGSAVLTVQYAELSDADRSAILEGNAARLLA